MYDKTHYNKKKKKNCAANLQVVHIESSSIRNYSFDVFLVAQTVKESTYLSGDLGLIPGLGRSLGGGHGNPLQYSCLENPIDRGAWRATVHGVTELDTTERLSIAHGRRVFLLSMPFPDLLIFPNHFHYYWYLSSHSSSHSSYLWLKQTNTHSFFMAQYKT